MSGLDKVLSWLLTNWQSFSFIVLFDLGTGDVKIGNQAWYIEYQYPMKNNVRTNRNGYYYQRQIGAELLTKTSL